MIQMKTRKGMIVCARRIALGEAVNVSILAVLGESPQTWGAALQWRFGSQQRAIIGREDASEVWSGALCLWVSRHSYGAVPLLVLINGCLAKGKVDRDIAVKEEMMESLKVHQP